MGITGADAGQYCKCSGGDGAFGIINNRRIAVIGIVGDKEMNNLKMLKIWNGYLSVRKD
ncbi:MAG: hypothetical protein Q7J27_03040 [Syntrophales bacterium]|nr:hypothetical protein [Syntrophales bacterium]